MESGLFEILILEITDAKPNWEVILKKQDYLKSSFCDFNLTELASYKNIDPEMLFMMTSLLVTV
jgi:3-methyladenine DNA glycosylase Tag